MSGMNLSSWKGDVVWTYQVERVVFNHWIAHTCSPILVQMQGDQTFLHIHNTVTYLNSPQHE